MMTTAGIFIFTMRKKLPVFIMCSDEGRETIVNNRNQKEVRLFLTTMIAVTILLMLSIFFSRVTVNVLVFVLPVVFFQVIMYVVCKRGTCTMLGVGILHYQQVLFQN